MMSSATRIQKALKHLLSYILPISATIVVPYFIMKNTVTSYNEITVLKIIVLAIGLVIICVGAFILIICIKAFISIGKGTLAPWCPTRKLIINGIYGHVRNPMISGVLFILLGESLVFQSWRLLLWFILFFIGNHIYFTIIEEPGLIKRFGAEYLEYRNNVPKWIPRLKAWCPRSNAE